ncbi:hypothetical protein CVT24_012071 [Panaeolus cyanescens]|uniref:Uncharacterized protein n=1 Tax=Panaeolus cyanescens TaxID=181874 RepID=A0A409YNG4_9AGAR|nr:hypothetical protein CVT24_012071 [Panaeolus cyanescens]
MYHSSDFRNPKAPDAATLQSSPIPVRKKTKADVVFSNKRPTSVKSYDMQPKGSKKKTKESKGYCEKE